MEGNKAALMQIHFWGLYMVLLYLQNLVFNPDTII